MKRTLYILVLASFGLMGTALAGIPGTYDLYTCEGSTFADGYTATVTLADGWEGSVFQGEDDLSGDCKGNKDEGFACTGSGNLITSRIDDAMVAYSLDNSTATQELNLPANLGDPTYAVVHANIFIPDGCFDEVSCAEAAAYTGEGMFAEGTPFSDNRPKPGKNSHKNWAMYVELNAQCQAGTFAVTHLAPPPDCASAEITTTAVADGGDWPDDFINAGEVTFTPDTDCGAAFVCESTTSSTDNCIE